MPLMRFREAMRRRLDDTAAAAQQDIPAQNVRNQLPGSALPPGGPAGAGYPPSAHNHAASDITSGTMATARLGSGTANTTTFLRGDSTWATPTATPSAHDHTSAAGDGGVLTNDVHDGYSVYQEIAAPSTPDANTIRLYAKDVLGLTELFYQASNGLERSLSNPTLAGHNHSNTAGDGGVLTNDMHDGYSDYFEIAEPSGPSINTLRLYAKDVAGLTELFYKNSAGTERALAIPSVWPVAQGGTGVTARPTFSAWLTAPTDQTIATGTFTKIQANNEIEDTNGNYDPTTNYRFTPTVAGRYLFMANVVWLSPLVDQKVFGAFLYKNGTRSFRVEGSTIASGTDNHRSTFAGFISANGSTDYFELYVYHEKGSNAAVWSGGGSFSAIWVGP